MIKLVDRFTIRDGRWDIDPRPYGATQGVVDRYRGQDIPGRGAAAHIFVKAAPGSRVRFFTEDATTPQNKEDTVGPLGWYSFFMGRGAIYWPPDQGPWHVEVDGVRLTDSNGGGIGLPEGLHVSTFLVVDDVDESAPPILPPAPVPGDRQYVRVVVETINPDGNVIKREIVWQS